MASIQHIVCHVYCAILFLIPLFTNCHTFTCYYHGSQLVMHKKHKQSQTAQNQLPTFPSKEKSFLSSNLNRKRKELMESIRLYKPMVNSVSQIRVLLIGAVGAGKSSFFNSINSVFRGHVTSQAISGSSSTSLTTQVSS